MKSTSVAAPVGRVCIAWLGFCCLLLPAVVQADPVTDYNVAVEFYKQQRWDLAADACTDFLNRNPNDERATTVRLYWAQSLLHLRKFAEAREQFQLFLKQAAEHADRPLAMYRAGECSYFLNDFPAAETELQAFLTAYPNHELDAWALVYLGESQLRMKKFDAAAKSFQAYVTRFPQGRLLDDAEFGLAAALEGLNQKDAARDVYQRIADRPQSSRAADALFNIASRSFDDQQFAQSAAQFQQLLTRFPKHRLAPAAHLNAGYAWYSLGKYAEALTEFEQAAVDPPHRVTALYWSGLCQKSLGNFAEAGKIFATALATDPQNALAEKLTFQSGDAEYRQSHYPQALDLFLNVVRTWPQGELADDALHSACETALQAGNLPQASELNQQFQKSFPMSGLAQVQELLWGRIQIAQGDAAGEDLTARNAAYARAAATLRHVLEVSTVGTTQNYARFQLARIAERENRDTDVMAELKPLLEAPEGQRPADYPDALLLNANAAFRLGKLDQAVASYRKFLEVSSAEEDRFAGLAGMASAQAALQDWAGLDATLDQFDKADPRHERSAASALAAGDIAFEKHAWEPAINCFQRVVALGLEQPGALAALSGVGHAAYELQDFPKAAAAFEQLTAAAAKDPVLSSHACYMQALALQQAKDLPAALKVYQQGATQFTQAGKGQDPAALQPAVGKNAYRCEKGGARVARELADVAASDRLYDAAYHELKLLPPAEQGELDLLINEWADLSYNAKNFARSDELFALLVKERPDSQLADDARLILAESLRFSDQKPAAIQAFQELAASPQADDFVRERSLTHLLDLYAAAGSWQNVVETAQQLAEKFPASEQLLYSRFRLGEGELHLEHYPAAAQTLQQVVDSLSKNLQTAPAWWTEAWLLLAEAQFWQKDYGKMSQTLDDLRSRAPETPLLYRADALTGRSLENQAKFAEARAAYLKVVDSASGRGTETAAEAQFRIAESYLKENNLPVALREYYKVYAGYEAPSYEAAALYQAAACDVSMKHFPEAADTYRKLIAEFPESDFAEKAKARLQELDSASKKSPGG